MSETNSARRKMNISISYTSTETVEDATEAVTMESGGIKGRESRKVGGWRERWKADRPKSAGGTEKVEGDIAGKREIQ
jgi:hypothetical protein